MVIQAADELQIQRAAPRVICKIHREYIRREMC